MLEFAERAPGVWELPRLSFDLLPVECRGLRRALHAGFFAILFVLWPLLCALALAESDPRQGLEHLEAQDRQRCEAREAISIPAYKAIAMRRCIANFTAKYEREKR